MKIFTNAQFEEEVDRIIWKSRREDDLRREITDVERQLYDIQRRLDRIEGARFRETTTEVTTEEI